MKETNSCCVLLLFLEKDKSTVVAAEVVNSMVLEFASQKEKAVQLIPGTDVQTILGEGDDVIQTHAESGRFIICNKRCIDWSGLPVN